MLRTAACPLSLSGHRVGPSDRLTGATLQHHRIMEPGTVDHGRVERHVEPLRPGAEQCRPRRVGFAKTRG